MLNSYVFAPLVGGIETVSALLAQAFVSKGHEVAVVTQTPAATASEPSRNYQVLRQPSPQQLMTITAWCDVFFQNNISLQGIWPLALKRKPWIVTHQTWIARDDGTRNWRDQLKRSLLPFGTSVAISPAIASQLPVPSLVIPNPYDESVFTIDPIIRRDRDLIFVGRLVSSKGVDLLLEALSALRLKGLRPTTTIVGAGPELDHLKEMAIANSLEDQVEFAGKLGGKPLATILSRHRILVVPSRWQEPFGVVALEGIACGCAVIGSNGGGLPDAIGPCGITFENNDSSAMARAIEELVTNPDRIGALQKPRQEHLQRHSSKVIASDYLKLFLSVLGRNGQHNPPI